jgi:hypothetical protein
VALDDTTAFLSGRCPVQSSGQTLARKFRDMGQKDVEDFFTHQTSHYAHPCAHPQASSGLIPLQSVDGRNGTERPPLILSYFQSSFKVQLSTPTLFPFALSSRLILPFPATITNLANAFLSGQLSGLFKNRLMQAPALQRRALTCNTGPRRRA